MSANQVQIHFGDEVDAQEYWATREWKKYAVDIAAGPYRRPTYRHTMYVRARTAAEAMRRKEKPAQQTAQAAFLSTPRRAARTGLRSGPTTIHHVTPTPRQPLPPPANNTTTEYATMQLETHQLYALFAMLVGTIVLIGLSYCTGLRSGRAAGYAQGRATAARYWKGLIKSIQGDLAELRCMLDREEQLTDSIRNQLNTLRTALHQEQAEHNTIVQDLLDELQRERSHGLTHADHQMLVQVARVLGHAAAQARKTGTSKTNQYATAQNQVTELAIRAHAAATAPKLMAALAESDITDTDLIEWLEKHAACCGEPESVVLEFPVAVPASGLPHLRDILALAVEQQRARQHKDKLERAEALGTWERVDAEVQPAAAMCA
tara:strand:+ start:4683 stop:5813 length:1131 start_codon:yes stop_codon:yes gene_type:complete